MSVPLFANAQDEAQAAQAAVDSQRIRTELQWLRGRVETETRQAWEEIREAETAQQVARLDLDLGREQVNLLLAQARGREGDNEGSGRGPLWRA